MQLINKEVCQRFIAKDEWKPIYCTLCNVPKRIGGRHNCENWKKMLEPKEDREQEERVDKFDERRKTVQEAISRTEDFTNPYELY